MVNFRDSLAESLLPLQYQWFFNSFPLAGATNATLMVRQVTPAEVGLYSVEISNGSGVLRTEPVKPSRPSGRRLLPSAA